MRCGSRSRCAAASSRPTVRRGLGERIKTTFGLTPEVEVLEMGTLAREFEKAVKVPRFVDRRG